MDCASCRVRIRTEWFNLSATDIDCLNVAKQRREYDAGESIFQAGEPCHGIHYVSGGLVGNLRRFGDATSGVLTFRYPGDTLGFRSFLSGGAHMSSAKAIQPSAVCFIDGETVSALMRRNPKTMSLFLRRLAGDLECAEEKLADPGIKGVRKRLVHLLAALRLAYARPETSSEGMIELPLTLAEIAAAVGASQRSLSIAVRRLEAAGIIAMESAAIRLLDAQRLRDVIGAEVAPACPAP